MRGLIASNFETFVCSSALESNTVVRGLFDKFQTGVEFSRLESWSPDVKKETRFPKCRSGS